MQLKTARIFVHDMAAAKAFYATALGLPLTAEDTHGDYCVFGAGHTVLVVECAAASAPQEERVLVGRFTGLSFTVPDIQGAYVDLRAKGVSFSGAPERQAWGGTLATFADPAGNALQLVQHP